MGIRNINLIDLSVYQCGTQNCTPGYSYGPAIRDFFLIHYIMGGEGIFKTGKKTYALKKDNGFLICPEQVTYYEANSVNPWQYAWIGFNGSKAKEYLEIAGLGTEQPIFECNNGYIRKCFEDMSLTADMGPGKEIRLTGLLYMFFSQLIENQGPGVLYDAKSNRKVLYVNKAIEFIRRNFSSNISVSDISKSTNLDRSYLGSIFKDITGVSPQQYLINFRVARACLLMKNDELSIGDIARSVGYKDPMLFSKIFKKLKKISPSQYRKNS